MGLQYDLLEPGLALSAAPHSASDLADASFAAILNVCDFGTPRYARGLRPDIELVRRPINDEYPVPLPSLILATLELADLRRRGLTTLVHCNAGQSRSPSIVALYWMARDGLT
jgi:Dual specificity phosphatase, catalytic domain